MLPCTRESQRKLAQCSILYGGFNMDLQLANKVALVTASSKGLGKAAARQFAREGARLVMCARSDRLEKSATENVFS